MLIDIAKRLKQEGISFQLIIAGTGPLEDKLKQLVIKNQLESNIQFAGFLSDIKSFLRDIDIFVFPSLWEGFGNGKNYFSKRPEAGFSATPSEERKRQYIKTKNAPPTWVSKLESPKLEINMLIKNKRKTGSLYFLVRATG